MDVTVLKPIFAEAASQLVNTTSSFSETVLIKKGHWVVDAKSLLGILALSLQPGDVVELSGLESTAAEQKLLAIGLFETK